MNAPLQLPGGRWSELRQLADGASAVVHEALDRWLGRRVVLKVAREEADGAGFGREAKLLMELRSPVFPEWIDWTPGDGASPAVLVLERRPGRPLADDPDVDPADLPWIAAQLLQGLCELAERGLAHGDLSPANVLLDGGRAALIDLGLARRHDDPAQRRSGTLGAMAPETLADGRIHPRSDLFSLGALLYRLLAGHSPFPGGGDDALRAMLDGRILEPARGGDHPLFPAVRACLARDPERRPDPAAWLETLCAGLPDERLALLAPRRLDPRLEDGGSVDEAAAGATLWIQLPVGAEVAGLSGRLRLAMAAAGRAPHPVRIDSGGLRGAFVRLAGGSDLERFPELEQTLRSADRRRELRPTVLRQLLLLLDQEGGRPQAPLLLEIRRADRLDETKRGDLERLARLCQHQRRPLVAICVGGLPPAPEHASSRRRLCLPGRADLRERLSAPLPGLRLDDGLVGRLDLLLGGRPQEILAALKRNLAAGRLDRRGALLLEGERPLEARPAWKTADLEALDPAVRDRLAEISLWQPAGSAALWQSIVAADASRELEWLEARGWLRRREDGAFEAQAEVRELLAERDLGAAHGRLLQRLLPLGEQVDDLAVVHLAGAGAEACPTEAAVALLLRGSGARLPESRARAIPPLLAGTGGRERAALGAQLVVALLALGRDEEALAWQRRLLRAGHDDAQTGLQRLLHVYRKLGRRRLVLRWLDRLDREDGSLDGRLARLSLRLDCRLDGGRLDAVRTGVEEAVALCSRLADPLDAQTAQVLNAIAASALRIGRTDHAASLWRRLGRQNREGLLVQQQVWLANNLGLIHLQENRLEQAREELDRAGRLASRYHLESYELIARVNLALVHLRRGDASRAVRELDPAYDQARQLEQPDTALAVLNSRGEALAALGHWPEAEGDWLEEIRLARECGRTSEAVEPLLQLLLLDHDFGLEPDAERLSEFLELATHCGDEEALVHWRLLRGEAVAADGPAVESRRALAEPEAGEPDAAGAVAWREACEALVEPTEGLRHLLAALERWPEHAALWQASPLLARPTALLHRLRLEALAARDLLAQGHPAKAGLKLGRMVGELHSALQGLPDGWLAKIEGSPLVEAFVRSAETCRARLEEDA